MAWRIKFTKSAEAELDKLDKPIKQRVSRFLDRVITLPSPRVNGDALEGPLSEFWRYRVGDYRIVCRIEDDVLVVLVVKIGHRREVYKLR